MTDHGIVCPFCGSSQHKVVDSRPGRDRRSQVRLRECLECDHRFPTQELYDPTAKRLFSTSAANYNI